MALPAISSGLTTFHRTITRVVQLIRSANYNLIENNIADQNVIGLQMTDGSDSNEIRNNRANRNASSGFEVYQSNRNKLRRTRPTRMATMAFSFSEAPASTHSSAIPATAADCLTATTKTRGLGTSGRTITLAKRRGSEAQGHSQSRWHEQIRRVHFVAFATTSTYLS